MSLHFLTPSYHRDIDRFVLLRRSIRRFAVDPVDHVVCVPRSDIPLFEGRLKGDAGVRVLAQQDCVDARFYPRRWVAPMRRALGGQAWRLERTRFVGRPGWIVQQIVKLSLPELCGDEAVCVVDSDLVFVRPFGRADLLPASGRVLQREDPHDESARHREHMAGARQLLGLAPASTDHHYMACPAVMYGDWVRALRQRLEQVSGRPWQEALFIADTFSEYLLYGVFLEEVLRPAELECRRRPLHVGIWSAEDSAAFLSDPAAFVAGAGHSPLTLVFQSNLGVPVSQYRAAVDRLLL